ncbi:hypothetical protein GCM10018980_70270 [Streptomyces capoamus]|uniref:Uncharacterized protein n=1 Tax=Streptomyces capoamus TaxID=68183 RepID=A0A919F394_9ACTN|nr:hypothetical protein GCM10010501_43530 [Streptomyces libani subsp. rufus]GHG73720.1 hypothetical protein GCM10018980_70270 [Streptomyces capoamus]
MDGASSALAEAAHAGAVGEAEGVGWVADADSALDDACPADGADEQPGMQVAMTSATVANRRKDALLKEV